LEDSADDGSLVLVYLEPFAEEGGMAVWVKAAGWIWHWHCAITEMDGSGAESALKPPDMSSTDLLHHLPQIQAVYKSMNGNECFSLLVETVDRLGDVDDPDAGKLQALKHSQRVGEVARDP
jgi:hypothetical protein